MNRVNWLSVCRGVSLAVLVSIASSLTAAEPKFDSKIVSAETKGHAVEVEADVAGAKSLFLVATDGGDGFGCDWADWAEPRFVGKDGKETKLTELKWKSASAGFGSANVNKNCGGDVLSIDGQKVEYGIGTHANSVIEFALPEAHGFAKFKARAGLDSQGTRQGCGSTVRFLVFTDTPDAKYLVASNGGQADGGSRDAKDAVKGLDVAEGLEATLFASEDSKPAMLNPTSIDIDHLGRVWVCEVVNYRHRLGERKEGDRILILEDTDGDGVSDKQTVFHQGRDVDTAHGICVLPFPLTDRRTGGVSPPVGANADTTRGLTPPVRQDAYGYRVIVSCGDSVFFLHDDNGDLKSDRKELLFTGIQGTQHDHGIHAFHFGPDGKLYFNFGNSGKRILDKSGKPITDLAGNVVDDSKSHYQEGMVFRCNMDGSEFETLGWNFRNNWEIAVDSFGSLWQSDNDDDGNKGVRINFVMEFGNYGYKDELTRAGWQAPRTNIEAEIPLRHWHLNDPGVVPNLLQTGAGSPTGIVVYEGDLLPEVFRNQVIHCDAGPNVVRAYPVKKSGAGYTAEVVNILQGARDNWFRPSDVCVAPDGSLFVADWYDPGVGGHRMGDADKGRLFRVAPPKTPYKIPKVDVSTVEGAIAALKSPNEATRYLAWTALHEMGEKVVPALQSLIYGPYKQPGKRFPIENSAIKYETNPRFRARALWVLGQILDGLKAGALLIDVEHDADLVVPAQRLARQIANKLADGVKDRPINHALRLVHHPDPAARREAAIALRDGRLLSAGVDYNRPNSKEDFRSGAFVALAELHDGKDRWHLEALGIAADGHWDACLESWLKHSSATRSLPRNRDIIWRSRGKKTPELLANLLAESSLTADESPRYLRAFDFQADSAEKQGALVKLAFGDFGDPAKTKFINTEAISRLKGFDVAQNPEHKAALNRVLDGLKGQPQFVALVEKFNATGRFIDLLTLAQAKPDDQIGIDAVRVLLNKGARDMLAVALASSKDDGRAALATVTALSNSGDGAAAPLLLPIVKDKNFSADIRRQAIKGATRTKAGATEVLKLSEAQAFDDSFAPALAAALSTAPLDEAQRATVAKLFPPPAGKDAKPLPLLTELAKLKGNAGNGAKLFAEAKVAKCNTCHVVNNQGKEVGPNLSEIGSKLSRQAMWESIIFPSAGISHNYESYVVQLDNGTVANGLKISEDADTITLRGADALNRVFKKKEIEEFKKQEISLMPADLAKTLSIEELADLVEYLTTLKKK